MTMTAPFVGELADAQRNYTASFAAAKDRLQPVFRELKREQALADANAGGTPSRKRERLLGKIAAESDQLRPIRERRDVAIRACVTMGLSPRDVAHVMCRYGERMAETKIKHIVTGGVPQAPLPHPGRVAH